MELLRIHSGYNGQERLNTVEVFDAQTGRWSKVM